MVKQSPSRASVTLVVAILLAAAWGVVAGWWTPRGPATATQALTSVGTSLAVGVLAGWLSRSRWAMLLTPVCFALAFEVVRAGSQGPSVDAPHLSPFGLIALVAGRGVHGLFSLLPLLVGAAYGAGLARLVIPGTTNGRLRRYVGRAVVGLLAVVLGLVTVAVALPARTDPILGSDGRPRPGSIAELTTVPVGDHELGLMIRGVDARAPVLLFLPGAPGGSEIGAMRRHLAALEQHFVVATLDKRGGSKSYAALEPASTLTVRSETRATLTVANYLRERFRQERIYLVAHSGGTIPGVLAVQDRPDLFQAYVGVGQVVSLRASDRIQYDRTLAWARETGREGIERQLDELGPPPYTGFFFYEPMVTNEAGAFPYDRDRNAEGSDYFTAGLGVPEYSLLDKVNVLRGFLDSYDVLYPREQNVDFRAQVPRLEVPVYFVAGANEVPGRTPFVQEWLRSLRAPHKELVVLADGGHRSMFEQPDRFVDVLTRVLAETRA